MSREQDPSKMLAKTLSVLSLLFAWTACNHDKDGSTSTGGQQAPIECGDTTCDEGEICVYTPAHCQPCASVDADTSSGDTESECEDKYVDASHVCEVVPADCSDDDSLLSQNCLGREYCYGHLWVMFSEGLLDCGAPPHTCV